MAQLTEKIFNEELNEPVVHETVRWLLASRRQGTHSAKTRAEVSGGGIKPWKQKGTGRARAGSIRSPLWRKGGVIFPPKPRDYAYNLPKKMRRLAMRVVLSELNRTERIKILEAIQITEPKTKTGAEFIKKLGLEGKIIIVLGADNQTVCRALRNLKGVAVMTSKDLNVFNLLNADWLVLEKSATEQLTGRLS